MTYEELGNLCGRMHRERRQWRAYVVSEGSFFNDCDHPPGIGEIRVRLPARTLRVVGRVLVSREQLAAHSVESLELLIDEIGISALLSQGV